MTPDALTLPLAFLAGLASFLSPCVLPLLPAYVGYLGGTAALGAGALPAAGTAARPAPHGLRITLHALAFVLGFSAVFVLLGASATLLGRLLLDYRLLLQRLGGVLLVVFGLRLMGPSWRRRAWTLSAVAVAALTFLLDSRFLAFGAIEWQSYGLVWLAESVMVGLVVLCGAEGRLFPRAVLGLSAAALNMLSSPSDPFPRAVESLLMAGIAVYLNRAELLYAERRLDVGARRGAGLGRSLLFGVVFAAGWTPCLGPILAAILLLASRQGTVGQGMVLLTAYSLGLAIPFLLVALAFGPLSAWLRRAQRHLRVVSAVSGLLLAVMGLLVLTDSLAFLAQYGGFFDLGL